MKANVTNWKAVLEYAAVPERAEPAQTRRPFGLSPLTIETLIFVVTMTAVTVGDVCAFFWMFK